MKLRAAVACEEAAMREEAGLCGFVATLGPLRRGHIVVAGLRHIKAGQIKIALDVTAKVRYGLVVVAELWVNGSFSKVIDTCYRRDFYQGKDTVAFGSLVSFSAGQSVELKNVMTAWDNQKPSNKYPNYAKPCDAVLKTGGVVTGYDCKVLTDIQGISLTPKCKYYPYFAVETPPVKPDISLDSKSNILCNGGSNGSKIGRAHV